MDSQGNADSKQPVFNSWVDTDPVPYVSVALQEQHRDPENSRDMLEKMRPVYGKGKKAQSGMPEGENIDLHD